MSENLLASLSLKFFLLLSAWKGRGEKLFFDSNNRTGRSLFVGCTNPGRRIFWAFHSFFSVSSIIWVLQDCWGEVRKYQLMLCVITIKNQRTVFELSLFASNSSFFLSVLVSAKDEYVQYFLLSKKKDVECTEKNFFSVYVSCLDRWGKNFLTE